MYKKEAPLPSIYVSLISSIFVSVIQCQPVPCCHTSRSNVWGNLSWQLL